MRLLRRLFTKLLTLGPRETARIIRKTCVHWTKDYLDRQFDRKYGVDTGGQHFPSELDIDSANRAQAIQYEPSPIRTLRSALSNLPSDLSEFVFLDFGSGKGRTLLVAADYNFKRIVGVEFARDLHRVAEANIRSYRSARQQCFQLESVCLDATLFPLPPEKLVLYFYFPFKDEVMSQVIDNIERSYRQQPRTMLILYYYPQLAHLLDARPFLRRVATRPLPFDPLRTTGPYRKQLRMYQTDG
jgi:SAM-dependent methyltransferase